MAANWCIALQGFRSMHKSPWKNHAASNNDDRAEPPHREREIVEYTVNLIKFRHPEWGENALTCQMGWNHSQSLPTT